MNPWGLKHVEDVKNQIKALILKVHISLIYTAWLLRCGMPLFMKLLVWGMQPVTYTASS